MKKLKLGIALAVSAISVCSIVSCGVTEKDDFVLSYKVNGSSTTKTINATDVYERYLKKSPKDHAKAYYDAINDVAIRLAFQEGGVLNKYQKEVTAATVNKIETLKDQADEADTDWDDYLEDTLGYNDDALTTAQNEHLLYLDKELEIMKEKVEKEYDDEFETWKKDKDSSDYDTQKRYNKVWGDDGYIETNMPYAVRHILVKCGDSSDNFASSTISSEQVTKLYRVINKLISTNDTTNTFAIIAGDETDDSGSTSQKGLYAMSTNTSFVNEFKLGIYTYESIINSETKAKYDEFLADKQSKDSNYVGFGGTADSKKTVNEIGANYIPLEAIQLMYDNKDLEKTSDGKEINEGLSKYYPRNVLFNKYFNTHNISFITNERTYYSENEDAKVSNTNFIKTDTGEGVYSDLDKNGRYENGSVISEYKHSGTKGERFYEESWSDGHEILHDEKGNPIMLALNATSSGGIHIMTIDRGYFDGEDGVVTIEDSNAEGGKYTVALNEYYAPEIPIYADGTDSKGRKYYDVDSGSYVGKFPYYVGKDGQNYPKRTFVNNDVVMDVSGYTTFKDNALESDMNNANINDSSIKELKQFEWLANDTDLTAKNETARKLIESYTDYLENTLTMDKGKTLDDAWSDYANTLSNQTRTREYELIPETCALRFKDAKNSDLYKEGGMCYYSSKINQ